MMDGHAGERAMELRHPFLASAASGILLGIVLRAATPVQPLPPREPPWRHAAPDPASEPVFSAETYAAGSWGGYADNPHYYPRWQPARYEPPRFEEPAPVPAYDRTAYDDPPVYDEPAVTAPQLSTSEDADADAEEPAEDLPPAPEVAEPVGQDG